MPGKLIDYLNPPLINPNTLMSIGYYAESTVPISTSKSIQVHVSQVTQVTLFLIQFSNILSSQLDTYYSVNACRHSHARPVLLKHKLSRFVFGVMNQTPMSTCIHIYIYFFCYFLFSLKKNLQTITLKFYPENSLLHTLTHIWPHENPFPDPT